MNKSKIFFSFSGLCFCLVLFSLAHEVYSEETINVASLCDRFKGTVDLRDRNHTILKYEEILPKECKILLAKTTKQYVVFSFYYWDVKGNDTLVIRDHYTELSLTGSQWYEEKTIIFKGPTTILFSMKDKFFSTRMNRFKFLYTVTYGGIRNCEKNDFVCNNKMCLNEHHLVCDGNNNCGDWSDEINCERTCTGNEFECTNSKCIPKYQLCNDKNDCGDMSDEEMCMSDCGLSYQYKCDNSICISTEEICDNKNDCGDWSDEKNCHRECDSLQFPCNNRKCIENSKVCNGIDDCGDNSDERKCTSCSSHEFKCSNRLCILKNLVCNNRNDCGDSSDEKNCSTSKRDNGGQTNVTVVDPWLITYVVCAAVLATNIVTFTAIFLRKKLKNKKEPTATQPPNVPTTTNVHNPQPSNMLGRMRQSLRSVRQPTPSTVQPPGNTEHTSVASGAQTSMYPHLQSGVDNPEFRAEE